MHRTTKFPLYSYYECRISNLGAVGSTFIIFSYDVVWFNQRTHQLPDAERMRYVLFLNRRESDIFGSNRQIDKWIDFKIERKISNTPKASTLVYLENVIRNYHL